MLPGNERRLALACCAVVAAADATLAKRSLGRPAIALLDEPAHVATTLLALLALPRPVTRRTRASALLASGLLDVDHVPSELGSDVLRRGTARPYGHSALGALAAAALARAARGSPAGAAFGVATHLLRDAASGPGVTLGWPLSQRTQRVGATRYHAAVALTAAQVVRRTAAPRRPRRARGSPPAPAPARTAGRSRALRRRTG